MSTSKGIIIKGQFNIKYTNALTIVFTEEKSDYDNLLTNIKSEEVAYHRYISKSDKSHAFVLRGLGEGTKIDDLEEDLMNSYEIKVRSTYRMTTKNRPLYLVVTDPLITLDYLNRNVRVVLYTRVTWELRRSTKQIIQCHNSQAWGHATSNCSRPPNCLKCAANHHNHHTRTCIKSRDTPAKCFNCGGDHPANFTKCKAYLDRVARIDDRKQSNNTMRKKYILILAPAPKRNIWDRNNRDAKQRDEHNEEFPLLPGISTQQATKQQTRQQQQQPNYHNKEDI
ncbi:unnamed protein product [Psylliodes chrysocephalus]|uniref:Nucleic-acid-binding protein from transposon X-element n=1 Tax=Psylliodes chrysocephalus TaxID=3402493 RepID=A0A9P0DCH0_9CUCU|nr:unnamed protein product [Psylliodes chrysocephala]